MISTMIDYSSTNQMTEMNKLLNSMSFVILKYNILENWQSLSRLRINIGNKLRIFNQSGIVGLLQNFLDLSILMNIYTPYTIRTKSTGVVA